MFIVTIDRPFYPSIEYFDTYEKAVLAAEQLADEENDQYGDYKVKVLIAEIKLTHEIKTCY